MIGPRTCIAVWLCSLIILAGCHEPSEPAAPVRPSFAAGGIEPPHTVVVNPNAEGKAIAATIHEAVEMVAPGGMVLVKPGTYAEALVIDKGLTLEGIGDGSEPVIIVSPPGLPNATIEVATSSPVTIRGLTVRMSGRNAILAQGIFDLTLERLTMVAVAVVPNVVNRLVRPVNDATQTGEPARLVVRETFFDAGTLPNTVAISILADIDALLEGNVIRRMGSACIFVQGRRGLPGDLHVDIVNNDLDECHAGGGTDGAIYVGPVAMPTTPPLAAIGVVNIVGNRLGNSARSCLPTTAIHYEIYTGRIEHNSIIGFLPQCAQPIVQALPAAIWVGSLRGYAPASPVVRFNDIEGNAHAGLRIAPNITSSIDARCNWWGSASGPAAGTDPPGSDIVVETPAAEPTFTPWATAPIAETDATAC